MSVELYSSIDELIEKEKNPADYCFDEAWLDWVCSAMEEAQDDARKACLSIELMKPSYFTDEGPVQTDMYERLLQSPKTIYSADYSADRMTNFYYAFKMAIAFLSPSQMNMRREDITPNIIFSTKGPRDGGIEIYRKGTCFSELYGAYEKALEDAMKIIGKDEIQCFQEAIRVFSKRTSSLGNYCCIPKSWRGYKSLNIAKAVKISLKDASGKNAYLNDQFALFLSWIAQDAGEFGTEELGLYERYERWMKEMLIECCADEYKSAFQCYMRAFDEQDPQLQIKAFLGYIMHVNKAIRERSRAIVAKIDPSIKGDS